MNKNITITAFLGALTIVLGAFGAHALKSRLTIDGLNSFETAVRYQMYHVLVLLIVNMYPDFSERFKNRITLLLILGIAFFSGSIYIIQLTPVTAKSIWFTTPFGGLLFIVSWMMIFYDFFKKTYKK